MGSYKIIYVDAPWKYRNWSAKKHGAARAHYEGLSIEELCALPVGDLAADNCALFLWITHPKMVEGLHVRIFEAWGFRGVSTAFVWVKTNRDGSPYMGVGFYTRGDSELCLLGLRGKMQRLDNKVRQTFMAPRTRHSAKPNEQVRDRIQRLFGSFPGQQLELFARPPVPEGWDAMGYEVDGEDVRKSLPKLVERRRSSDP